MTKLRLLGAAAAGSADIVFMKHHGVMVLAQAIGKCG